MLLVRALDEAGARAAKLPLEEGVVLTCEMIDEVLPKMGATLPTDRAVLHFVARNALAPRTLTREHLDSLRQVGLSERALHDVVNVACCFSYMNRLADGLGVVLYEERREWAVRLFGEERWTRHLAWGDPDAAEGAEGPRD